MIFLQGLYEYVSASFGMSINHFPLVRLIFTSVDKTILYYLIWLTYRVSYLLVQRKASGRAYSFRREMTTHFLFVYIVLLLQLTVFRNEETFLTVKYHQIDWAAVHLVPLVDSIKLFYGDSDFSAYYNSLGNVFWFMPFGFFGRYLLREKCSFSRTVGMGILFSCSIEFLQLIFQTGVTHIDDVLFNTGGTAVGYGLLIVVERFRSQQKNNLNKGRKQ